MPAESPLMPIFTVRQGRRYRARIALSWLESFATNETIEAKLREAGFTEVDVRGSGATRLAEARWGRADASAEMPAQISEVSEL
jgi:hypothetical protein